MNIKKLLKLIAFTTTLTSCITVIIILLNCYITNQPFTIDPNKFGENLFELFLFVFLALGTIAYFIEDLRSENGK